MSPNPSSPDRGIHLARVVEHHAICRQHFRITLSVPRFPHAEPGQFIQILCHAPSNAARGDEYPAIHTPMLRRPFSIGGLERDDNDCRIAILGRVIGAGTAWLDALRPGDAADILGPLGRTFSTPLAVERALLVAGGIGLPPIRWQCERLTPRGVPCESIVGARTREFVPLGLIETPSSEGEPTRCAAEFTDIGVKTAITTDDGSCGLHGRVTDALDPLLDRASDPKSIGVYACGPDAMLRAVAKTCLQRGVWCELAMERVMGCGMGTCQSCVVPVRDESSQRGWRYALCCTEGPVFEAGRLVEP